MNYRLNFMLWLYSWSQQLYIQYFKKKRQAWGLSKKELCLYPKGTLGKALGNFYKKNRFEVMPKLENHDVFHVLTQTNVKIEDEIAMQYLLLGNGKKSLYLLGMISIGTIIYPEFMRYYIESYQRGKSYLSFYKVDFKKLLGSQLHIIQGNLKIKSL